VHEPDDGSCTARRAAGAGTGLATHDPQCRRRADGDADRIQQARSFDAGAIVHAAASRTLDGHSHATVPLFRQPADRALHAGIIAAARADRDGDVRRGRTAGHGAACGADLVQAVGLFVARMVHHRRSQADRHHVHDPRRDHAPARLFRRDHDAVAAGMGVRRVGGISQRPPFRSGVHRPRRDHDLLRGDADRHRPDELCPFRFSTISASG
jgi:hypothetical protein